MIILIEGRCVKMIVFYDYNHAIHNLKFKVRSHAKITNKVKNRLKNQSLRIRRI